MHKSALAGPDMQLYPSSRQMLSLTVLPTSAMLALPLSTHADTPVVSGRHVLWRCSISSTATAH